MPMITPRPHHHFPLSVPSFLHPPPHGCCSAADAPPPAGSAAISVSAKADGAAGRAAARASSAPAAARAAAGAAPLALYETPRVSVLHASLMEHLLRLAHERYGLLSQWPDFAAAFSKDAYYRAHPEDLRRLYKLADEWHAMFDAVTEFESLSHLATQMVPVSLRFCCFGWRLVTPVYVGRRPMTPLLGFAGLHQHAT